MDRFCGFHDTIEYTINERYAYITFHTNGEENSQRRRGFSRVEFTAQGLFIVICDYKNYQMNCFIDIDECPTKYCAHGCVNLVGSYKCTCKEGYYLVSGYRCFGNHF